MRNLILTITLATASLFDMAAQTDDYTAGKEHAKLNSPVPVSQPGKIEMVELFWYGCPHYYALEPTIILRDKKLPANIRFMRLPALFGGIWDVHGQMFLTLESMGVEHDVHNTMFEAIRKEHKKLATPEEITDFLTGKGVDKEEFLNTYNSSAIKGQMEKAKEPAMAYQVTGVPAMVVNDRYHFNTSPAGDLEGTLKLADYLIEKEHATAKW